jgi:hypothetical protein
MKKLKKGCVEHFAIEYVINYLATHGKEVKKAEKNIGCDLITSDGCYIEVKGMQGPRIGPIQIYESIFRKPEIQDNYYVYVVYDIGKSPKLKIIEPDKLKWHDTKIRILDSRVLKEIFPIPLTKQNISEIKTEREYSLPLGQNEDLLQYIRNLGDDIDEEKQSCRLCFSSISRQNKTRKKLVWLYRAIRNPWKFWIRKEIERNKYPDEIKELTEYVSGKKSKDRGYPHFKLQTVLDLKLAKKVIKFAYDKL